MELIDKKALRTMGKVCVVLMILSVAALIFIPHWTLWVLLVAAVGGLMFVNAAL